MFRFLICAFLGSGLGGVLRYLVSYWLSRINTATAGSFAALFPWATLLVNVAGCFVIGLLYGLIDAGAIRLSDQARTFLTVGLCGGLTTFSTFTHENYLLFQSHAFGIVLIYAAVSLILGFACAWAGHAVATL